MIYLDNAATTFPKPERVYEEMDKVNRTLAVNSGRGSYRLAKEANNLIQETKAMILGLFNADGFADIVFTPSVTHAFNQILWGLSNLKSSDTILVSPYEHNAIMRTLEHIKNIIGINLVYIPVGDDGEIDLKRTEFLLAKYKPRALLMSAISNVTGYMLPYKGLFEISKQISKDTITILDAAQAAGLIELDMKNENIDILCFAGHKTLYGPFGIAGFVIKRTVTLDVTFTGGTGSNSLNKNMPEVTPEKYEASSPNIVAISGLHASLQALNIFEHYKVVREITDYTIKQLSRIPRVHVLGLINEGQQNLGIVSFVCDGYSSSDVGQILDQEYDIAVRTGFHCAPDIHDIIKDKEYEGAVRVGIGIFNTTEDIDVLVSALKTL